VLKEQAKKVLKDPYATLLKTWRAFAQELGGSLWEVPFVPARDDMPPGYNEAQLKLGEWIRSAQVSVNYKGYRIELRSIAPVLTDKLYMISYKVKYDTTKDFYLNLGKKSWSIPGATNLIFTVLQQVLPDLKQEEKDKFDLFKKELNYPLIRTGSLEVDNNFEVRGDNELLARESFAKWQIREVYADPDSQLKSLIVRGRGFSPELENSIVISGAVDPSKTEILRRGFDVIKAELDVLLRLGLIEKGNSEQTPGA
jgi:hypothetical protein